MLKLTFCLHRLPGLSREDFQTYWRETHAPLVAERAQILGIQRYVQTHTLTHAANAAIAASRGAPAGFDGIAELWWESWQSFVDAGDSEAAKQAGAELLQDEKRFIDLSRSPLWFNQEHVIVG